MFVTVEVQPGEWCIGLLPVVVREKKNAQVDFFKAECVEVRLNGTDRECKMDFSDILSKYIWVPEYRICDFTFGGVMMSNAKFDPIRIDKEDAAWLQMNFPAGPAPNTSQGLNKPGMIP